MKRIMAVCIAGSFLLLAPRPAEAFDGYFFQAAQADGIGNPPYLEVGGFPKCECQVTSAAGATAIVYLESSTTSAGPWTILQTFTDPGVNDKDNYVFGSCPRFVRGEITGWSSGAITMKFTTLTK